MDTPGKNQQGRWTVHRVTETGSTNADLLAAGVQDAPDRTVLRADHQTAGRGRLDREWVDTPGRNLLVSFLFRDVPSAPHVLTQAVALGALEVARELGVPSVLKWPNDLLVGDRKLSGVLAQAGPFDGDVPSFVVVGIGVNIGSAPDGATCIAEHSATDVPAPDEFMLRMLPVIDEVLAADGEGRHARYRAALATLGSRVRVRLPDGSEIVGRALNVTADGRLEVLDECAVTHRLDTADVVHLRAAD
ncbi:MAG: biotin--[acetyl-CoA-carboxylase] ligase [Acidimicrobiales bacterium]